MTDSVAAQTRNDAPTGGRSIYSCVDETGRRHMSDRPIVECAKRPMRELRADGATKRNIAAPLTRRERELQAAERAAERVQQMRERQQQARDRALMRAYPTIDDLYAMRDRQLDELQALIEENYARMVKLHDSLRATQSLVNKHPPGKAPGRLKQQVARLASEILAEDSLVKARLREQAMVREKFDKDAARLEHLLELAAEADRRAG